MFQVKHHPQSKAKYVLLSKLSLATSPYLAQSLICFQSMEIVFQVPNEIQSVTCQYVWKIWKGKGV